MLAVTQLLQSAGMSGDRVALHHGYIQRAASARDKVAAELVVVTLEEAFLQAACGIYFASVSIKGSYILMTPHALPVRAQVQGFRVPWLYKIK